MFGERIRQLREQLGLTKAEYGKELGMSESWVSRVESGQFVNIKPGIIEKMAYLHKISTKEVRDIIYGKQGGGVFREIERLNAYRNFQKQIGVVIVPITFIFNEGVVSEFAGEDEVIMSVEDLETPVDINTVFAIRVKDGSMMSHGVHQDDCLFVDPSALVEDAKMYLVRINGEFRIVNIYKHRDENIIVIGVTDGKYYEYSPSDVEIRGRIIGFSGFHHL